MSRKTERTSSASSLETPTSTRRALEAFEEGLRKGTASVNVDGRMIDIASAERCRRILGRADAIADMERRKNEALKDPDAFEKKLRAAIDEI